ncbi:MAG: spore cortex biosynthesis protein YabQ [Clostridia bacterium]|nr:spore cortex biosynthesis protein YabQ [Clostridia bacterium]
MEISQQALLLLHAYALLLGGILGLFYDCFRITRIFLGAHYNRETVKRLQSIRLPLLKPRKARGESHLMGLIVFLEDLLFCLLSGGALILLFYELNHGSFRFTAVCCAGVGFLLYRATLGQLVMLCSEGVAFVFETALRYLAFFILFPFRILWRLVKNASVCIYQRIEKKRKKLQRIRYTEITLSQTSKNACGMLPEIAGEKNHYKKGKRYGRGKEKTIQPKPAHQDPACRHGSGVHRDLCK